MHDQRAKGDQPIGRILGRSVRRTGITVAAANTDLTGSLTETATLTVGADGGITASALHWTEYVPPIMSALAALATLVYMLIKINKEMK